MGSDVKSPFIVGKYLTEKYFCDRNDILTQTEDGYRVYDFFLSEWLATVY